MACGRKDLIYFATMGYISTREFQTVQECTWGKFIIIIINAGAGDVDDMRDREWATLFHCMSTDDDPNHTRCPSSKES